MVATPFVTSGGSDLLSSSNWQTGSAGDFSDFDGQLSVIVAGRGLWHHIGPSSKNASRRGRDDLCAVYQREGQDMIYYEIIHTDEKEKVGAVLLR
jgi:hypothetical protein